MLGQGGQLYPRLVRYKRLPVRPRGNGAEYGVVERRLTEFLP